MERFLRFLSNGYMYVVPRKSRNLYSQLKIKYIHVGIFTLCQIFWIVPICLMTYPLPLPDISDKSVSLQPAPRWGRALPRNNCRIKVFLMRCPRTISLHRRMMTPATGLTPLKEWWHQRPDGVYTKNDGARDRTETRQRMMTPETRRTPHKE